VSFTRRDSGGGLSRGILCENKTFFKKISIKTATSSCSLGRYLTTGSKVMSISQLFYGVRSQSKLGLNSERGPRESRDLEYF